LNLFYLDKIVTHIDIVHNIFIIKVSGILKEYSKEEIIKKFNITEKPPFVKITKQLTAKYLKDHILEGFYKLTDEGDVMIDNIGLLNINPDTVKLKIIKFD